MSGTARMVRAVNKTIERFVPRVDASDLDAILVVVRENLHRIFLTLARRQMKRRGTTYSDSEISEDFFGIRKEKQEEEAQDFCSLVPSESCFRCAVTQPKLCIYHDGDK